jgi:site-specific recombinase XerD
MFAIGSMEGELIMAKSNKTRHNTNLVITNKQLIIKYANCFAGKQSQSTIKSHCMCVKQFLDFLDKPINAITAKDIDRWIDFLSFKSYSQIYIKTKKSFLHIFLDWCFDQELIKDKLYPDAIAFNAFSNNSNNERG